MKKHARYPLWIPVEGVSIGHGISGYQVLFGRGPVHTRSVLARFTSRSEAERYADRITNKEGNQEP